jgi:hypothetical protein
MKIILKNNDYLTQDPESIFRKEEDGAFLFDPKSGNLKYINCMGVNIYQLCNGNGSVADITSLVAENYRDIPERQIKEDIKNFLQDLIEMKFVTIQPQIHTDKRR